MNKKNIESTDRDSLNFDVCMENDYELLELITWYDSEPKIAQEAWAEFYKRHSKYIFYIIQKKLYNTPLLDMVSDITTDTFIKVFEGGAKTFKKSEENDTDRIRGHVRAWLGKIAANLINDLFKGHALKEINLSFDIYNNFNETSDEFISEDIIKLNRIINENLNEREKHILNICSQYFDPKNPTKQLPTEELDEICLHWNITRANFRQIKKRAIEKIKDKWESTTLSF